MKRYYYPVFCNNGDCVHIKQHTKHKQNEHQTHFSAMAAAANPQPPWCSQPGAKAYNNQLIPLMSFLSGKGVVGSDEVLLW